MKIVVKTEEEKELMDKFLKAFYELDVLTLMANQDLENSFSEDDLHLSTEEYKKLSNIINNEKVIVGKAPLKSVSKF